MTQKLKTKQFVHIGGDSRSGGSLLARLFNGHPKILSYPFENEFFNNRNSKLANFEKFRNSHAFEDIEEEEVVLKIKKFAEAKLTSKLFYDDHTDEFDYERFKFRLMALIQSSNDKSDVSIFEKINRSFFETYLDIDNFDKFDAVSNHCSRTFIADLDSFYASFSNGFFLQTLRDIKSTTASMQNYSYLIVGKTPSNLDQGFINEVLERWLIALYVGIKNQINYSGRFIIVPYEKIIINPEGYLSSLCEKLNLEFNVEMLTPKYGKHNWTGNSSYGKLPPAISNKPLERYKETLSADEIKFLDEETIDIVKCFNEEFFNDTLELIEQKLKQRRPEYNLNRLLLRKRFNEIHNNTRKNQLNIS